jgi:hypothetical protein
MPRAPRGGGLRGLPWRSASGLEAGSVPVAAATSRFMDRWSGASVRAANRTRMGIFSGHAPRFMMALVVLWL